MNEQELSKRLQCARETVRKAGKHLRECFLSQDSLLVDAALEHDIKLRLDKETQALIESELLARYPNDAILGEEGDCASIKAEAEWIIDPIDGTVNFFYGLPLFCVSLALRVGDKLLLGCVYDPMRDEMFEAMAGGKAYLNGREIHVSARDTMAEAILFVGHGRHDQSGAAGIARFAHLSAQVRKVRILGTAALSLCYIAAGRMDAYIENSIYLWDFAAAKLIIEAAGGVLDFTPSEQSPVKGAVVAYNGRLPLTEALQGV